MQTVIAKKLKARGIFIEPGCGLSMELGRWYILGDSGYFYTPKGYDSPEAAIADANMNLGEWGFTPTTVTVFHRRTSDNWMTEAVNIVLADDLLEHWDEEDAEYLVFSNPGV